MKSTLTVILLSILIIGTNTGCDSPYGSKMSPGITATGDVGEILVVCDQGIWESDIKLTLDSLLTQFILPYFPDVATFEIITCTPSNFVKGKKRHRNVLMLNIDPAFSENQGTIKKRKDVWSDQQAVVEITAKDFNQLHETCMNGLWAVHDVFDEMEWKRPLDRYVRHTNQKLKNEIENKFGVLVDIPSGSNVVTRRKNFYRIEFPASSKPIEFVGSGTQDPGTILTGVMIYQYNFTDSSQFELEQLCSDRDTMLKYNVPYDISGMYMGTQYEKLTYPILDDFISSNGKIKGVEMRGMFKFLGLGRFGRGGAFWACHFYNEKTKKIVCVSTYLDASPMSSWTKNLRELQAVIKSVEIEK